MKKENRRLKIALYNPYLNILGGGERHILSIIKALEEETEEINIFWNENLEKEILQKFSLQFINKLKWLPNIFKKKGNWWEKIIALRKFDLFFYIPDGSYFFSSAKKNFIFCMVPDKKLYPQNFLNRMKTFNFQFITNSFFTKKWLKKWGIKAEIIYPYLQKEFLDLKNQKIKKEKIILSVGRFFSHLHEKNHQRMIEIFKKKLRSRPLFKEFKLILTGSVEKQDINYFNQIKSLVKNDSSIILKPNIAFAELLNWYKKSMFFWHFTGFGIDEKIYPQNVEHLGIAPLEAMASGCLTFGYNAGGPKEIIKDGFNGFLFSSESELIEKMSFVFKNKDLRRKIIERAQQYTNEKFNFDFFKQKVYRIILRNSLSKNEK